MEEEVTTSTEVEKCARDARFDECVDNRKICTEQEEITVGEIYLFWEKAKVAVPMSTVGRR